jgi:hypothetical protein
MERKLTERKREPSRLALQLAEAFAPCSQWSEVRVERGAGGRRMRVIVPPAGVTGGAAGPFDWAGGAL